jgi:hypothetical protein
MKIIVTLDGIVEAMDLPSSECSSYLNHKTGEIVTLTEEDQSAVENPDDIDDLPEWQKELLPKFREVMESDDWLCLPDKFEIHEWSIMERFSMSLDNVENANRLLGAIHGTGVFRRFKETLYDMNIQDEWYKFRDEAFKQIARNWCDEHEIEYK